MTTAFSERTRCSPLLPKSNLSALTPSTRSTSWRVTVQAAASRLFLWLQRQVGCLSVFAIKNRTARGLWFFVVVVFFVLQCSVHKRQTTSLVASLALQKSFDLPYCAIETLYALSQFRLTAFWVNPVSVWKSDLEMHREVLRASTVPAVIVPGHSLLETMRWPPSWKHSCHLLPSLSPLGENLIQVSQQTKDVVNISATLKKQTMHLLGLLI